MGKERLLMELFYGVGFLPWDGHGMPAKLVELVEGPAALAPGRALDVGCGTGDTAIYLARHGWDVTAVDYVKRAIKRARAKAEAAGVKVNYIHGSAVRLSSYGIGKGFALAVDSGCMHGQPDSDRAAYVGELNALMAGGGRLILAAYAEGNHSGPRGINRPEIERRFSSGWELLSGEPDPAVSNSKDVIHVYELRRATDAGS